MESGPLFVDALSPAVIYTGLIRTGGSTDMKRKRVTRRNGASPNEVCAG